MLSPILVTVGPQCSGKTTFLKGLSENVIDNTLDEIPGTYDVLKVNIVFDNIVKPNGICMESYEESIEQLWVALYFTDVRDYCVQFLLLYIYSNNYLS